jgi:hypothetical protein
MSRQRSARNARGTGRALNLVAFVALAPACAAANVASANADGWFGLYPAADFAIGVEGAVVEPVLRQAAWYFRHEDIAVPRPGLPLAGFETGVRAFDDVRHWTAGRAADAPIDFPPLVWVAAPQRMRHARLDAAGREAFTAAGSMPLRFVPKIELNRSYLDASSLQFFATRELTLRGTKAADAFVARTIWPEDFRLGPGSPPTGALPAGSPTEAIRALMREQPRGGAQSPYTAMTLWQRTDSRADWAGRPVLGLMVNGAQGDDDEAHG